MQRSFQTMPWMSTWQPGLCWVLYILYSVFKTTLQSRSHFPHFKGEKISGGAEQISQRRECNQQWLGPKLQVLDGQRSPFLLHSCLLYCEPKLYISVQWMNCVFFKCICDFKNYYIFFKCYGNFITFWTIETSCLQAHNPI